MDRLCDVPIGTLVQLACGCTVRRGHDHRLTSLIGVTRTVTAPGCPWTTDPHTSRAKGCAVTLVTDAPTPPAAEPERGNPSGMPDTSPSRTFNAPDTPTPPRKDLDGQCALF